jgi:serine/threonine protein kinase
LAFALVGQTVEHFELLGPLGAGAMSEVYLGRDTRLDKKVAIKVINENLLRRPDLVERFEREARAAARLSHENVATVYFFGSFNDKPFYAMELIKGWSLGDLVENHVTFTWDQMLGLFAQAAMGLQAAVDAGIMHRDIKPGNLMATEGGRLKIVDFGLAKLGDDNSLTRSGAMMGTPYYIAPEVVQGQGSDHLSDIYSLGVTMFHNFAGRPPYDAETPYGVMMQHISEPIPALKALTNQFPPGLSDLVQVMMSKEPRNRPQTYRDVAIALRGVADEMGAEQLAKPLSWCHFDKANTETEGGRCAVCKRQRGAREVAEIFHVDLVGWHRNDAVDAVAGYIAKAVGQGPSEIRTLLDPLPFRAAFRVPRERARRMQRTFYDLGADVSLVPADDDDGRAAVKDVTFAAIWPQNLGSENGKGVLTSTTRAIRVKPRRRALEFSPATLVAGGLSVIVLVLLGILFGRELGAGPTPGPTPAAITEATPTPIEAVAEASPTPAAAEETPATEGDPEVVEEPTADAIEATEEPTAEPVLEKSYSTERVKLDGLVDPAYGDVVLAAFDRGAKRAEELAGELDEVVVVELVDGSFSDWRKAATQPVVKFPIQGLATGGLDAAADELMMRAAIQRRSGGSAPVWLTVGLGAWLSEGPVDADAWPEIVERGAAPTELTSMMFLATHESREAVRAFVTWLLEEKGWSRVGYLLDYLNEGQDLDVATRRAMGDVTFSDLEQLWVAAAGGAE